MNETTATFPDSDNPTTITDTGVEGPKTYMGMNYLKKKTIDEAICQ